jgi:hypothetical protein
MALQPNEAIYVRFISPLNNSEIDAVELVPEVIDTDPTVYLSASDLVWQVDMFNCENGRVDHNFEHGLPDSEGVEWNGPNHMWTFLIPNGITPLKANDNMLPYITRNHEGRAVLTICAIRKLAR